MPDPRQNHASDAAERPLENGSAAGSSGGDIGIEVAGPSQARCIDVLQGEWI